MYISKQATFHSRISRRCIPGPSSSVYFNPNYYLANFFFKSVSKLIHSLAVSYTHLTLPTICSV